jgi:Family of unknown function (DUF5317)
MHLEGLHGLMPFRRIERSPMRTVSMLFGAVLVLCLVSVPLAGGRLAGLADTRFRWAWLALAGLAVQVVVISVVPAGSSGLHHVLHIASYVLLGAMLAANLHVPYLWLVGLGGLSNFVAIVANGGVMPATRAALHAAGTYPAPGHFTNSTALAHPHLLALGDRFAIPAPWAHNVFSVGDILMAVGALLALHVLAGSRLGTALRGLAWIPRRAAFTKI